MDLIILIVLLFLVIFFFRKLSNVVYFIAIVDIFFRLVDVINEDLVRRLSVKVYRFLNYIPGSIPDVFRAHSSGIVYTVLFWCYVVVMIIFLGYTIRTFFRKKH